ncbi:hypothetical protein ACHAXN_001089 [Cyclotella atomus]
MISTQAVLVFVAGGICCLNAPALVYKHFLISKSPNLRSSIEMLRAQVNILKESTQFLSRSVSQLQDEVEDIRIDQQNLENIVSQAGYNCLEFIELVKENEALLDRMKRNLRETFVTEMTKLILRSDKDDNMKIDLEESRVLALRLKVQLQPHGIDLDSNKFQRMIREDNSIPNILKFCGEVLFPEVTARGDDPSIDSQYEDDSYLDEDDEYNYDPVFEKHVATHGSKPASLSDYCKTLSRMTTRELDDKGDGKMTTEDKLGMFTVHSKFSRGSVEVARGSRMSVLPRAQVRKKRYNRVSQLATEAHRRASITQKTVVAIEKKTKGRQIHDV